MAWIEQLVDLVADDALRQELAAEVAALKRRQQFGLVFERHIPETTLLPHAPIRVGSTVVRRRDPKDTPLRVLEMRGDELVVAPIAAGETRAPRRGRTEAGEPETVARADVFVKKAFEETVYPTLTSIGRVERGSDKPYHAVIQGENFHAVELLVFALEGQVDCIYLDPPYNTGARDWKYNNDYVDSSDAWRHSKWLAFMEKRLRLARRLLKPDGVLIVTIDEHEVHHLGMLLEQTFPELLRTMVTIVVNPKGTGATNFARVDEYAIFVCPPGRDVIAQVPFGFGMPVDVPVRDYRVVEDSKGDGGFVRKLALRRDGAESSNRRDRPRQFYAIHVDPETQRVTGVGPALALDEAFSIEPVGGCVPVYPIDRRGRHRVWRYGRDTMLRLIQAGEIRVTRFDAAAGSYSLYHFSPVDRAVAERRRPRTVWWHSSHDAGAHGSSLLNELLGQHSAFAFPKSVYAVADTLRLVTAERPDALILDFFAGSGTTLHSTWLLNAEDGGHRRCLLVTNNELSEVAANALRRKGLSPGDPDFEAQGIFESVTRPRVSTALTGRRPDGSVPEGRYASGRPFSEGFEENVEFLRLDYLDPIDLELGRRFEELLPTLWLSVGSCGKREGIDLTADFSVATDGPYAFLMRPSGVDGLLMALDGRQEVTHVFVLTDSEDAFSELAEQLPATLTVRMLPRDYLRSFTNGRESAG